jgi:hypothetical protein
VAIPPERRRLVVGIVAVACAVVSLNILYAAAEQETVETPTDRRLLVAGLAVALAALPLAILAVRGPGAPRVLGWIAIVVLALCVLAATAGLTSAAAGPR